MGKYYKLEISETINHKESLKNLSKSGEKLKNGKSKREVEQYVGNKEKKVVSEFERIREEGKKTKVTHKLWRRFGNVFKKVHEHEK